MARVRRGRVGGAWGALAAMGLGVLVATVLPASAGEWSPLQRVAPTPDDLLSAVDELERRLDHAAVVHDAVGMLQNALAAGLDGPLTCDDPAVASLIARARAFGQAHRDAAQSSDVQRRRVDALDAALSPLIQGPLADRIDALGRRADLEVARQEEAASWQWRYVEQRDEDETCTPTLAVADGLDGWRRPGPVAIWVLGEGLRIVDDGKPGAVRER